MRFIKFEKNGCMPCKKMDNILKKLNVECEHFNVEEAESDEELIKYGIAALPTLIKVKEDGYEKLMGAEHTIEEFKSFCEIE